MHEQGHAAAGVNEGDILAGKYRIDKILGVGGMGVVVAAHHIQLDDRVAIKFLLPDALKNPDAVSRFAREARAAVKIRGEHVARVTDVGTLENGSPYMVMEYLEGTDLAGWVERQGALPIEQAVEFLLQACEAIAEAHVLGIVHRDLKPANLFVVRRPDGTFSVKVLDFGISKTTNAGASRSDMTQTKAVMGSPLYMSPEQMQSSKDVDLRTDVWALGIILYELLTADVPFMGDTMPELVVKIMSSPPRPLRNFRPDAPLAIEAVLLKCLEKDRTRRYATVGELAVALAPFGPRRSKASVERISGILRAGGLSDGGGPPLSFPPPSQAVSSRAAAGATGANWGRSSLGQKSTAGVTIAALVFGGVVIAGGAFALLRSKSAPEGADSAATGLPSLPAPATASANPPSESASAGPRPPSSAASAAPSAKGAEPSKAPTTAASTAAVKGSPAAPRVKPAPVTVTTKPSSPPSVVETVPVPTPRQKPKDDWGGRL